MVRVPLTRLSANDWISLLNLLTDRYYERMEKKIFVKESSFDGGIHIIWNLLESLLVISLLPPVGGAAESITTVLSKLFQLRAILS